VELMGGELEVESELGKGSTFRFELVLPVDSSAIEPVRASTETSGPDRSARYVLLVEDNLVNQTVAKYLLTRAGCRVDLAEDGHEAVAKVEREAYDVVFMDCLMPGMDGYAATAE